MIIIVAFIQTYLVHRQPLIHHVRPSHVRPRHLCSRVYRYVPWPLLHSRADDLLGRTAILRLLQVAKLAPSPLTKRQALLHALEIIKRETLDTELYNVVVAQLSGISSRIPDSGDGSPLESSSADVASEARGETDEAWLAKTTETSRRTGEKLDAEMRNYSINMIKESTRQTLLAMSRHQRAAGDNAAAQRTLHKLRDYQSGAEHEVGSGLAMIEVALIEGQYNVVLPTVIKAQHALGRLASAEAMNTRGEVLTGEQIRERERRQRVIEGMTAETGAKLGVAKGVSLVATGQWEAGVRELVALQEKLGDWEGSVRPISCSGVALTVPQVFSLSDIATYTSLAALATLPRDQLKSNVLENSNVRFTMDHGGAPWTREIVEAFVGARYHKVLQLLEAYKVRLPIHTQNKY
jgi:COP9 signalosome complex subunit 1